ncbi:MAG: spore cortex biosynthesis protein YabQ [Oscillospiraceae bacterium]|nr:spore cortex biosynthesis protein YabQ [Oscillospiraceae bacterium]
MNIIISEQLIFFLRSILLGVILGFVFDVFKILRLLVKHNNIFVFIEDILFFCISAIFSYSFLINISYGQIRLFILIGQLIGFILYKLSVSNFVVKLIVFVINLFLRTIVRPIYKFALCIFKVIFVNLTKFFIKNVNFLKKLLKNRIDIVYNFLKHSFIKNKIIDQ